jgi:5-methylcytosine-specific restriction endonuclease McrA
MEVDHQEPLIPINKTLEEMEWSEVVDRLWCDVKNLRPLCKPCHKEKSKEENKERRLQKKAKK